MSKYKRNDRCYCGSGNKYKKCCGRNQAQQIVEQRTNDNLLQLHQKLITAISTKYSSGLEKQALKHAEIASLDEETTEIYKTGLIPWMITHSAHLPQQQTVIDDFIKEQNLSVVMKKYAHIWKAQQPSIYEVSRIDVPKQYFVTVTDILTDRSYYIPYHNRADFIEGNLIVGTLIAFESYHNFLYTVIKLYNRDKNDYIKLLAEFNRKPGGLKAHYPAFFAAALTAGLEQFDFDNPVYGNVAQLFVDQMIENNATDQLISEGIVLWKQFCTKHNPIIKKPEVYAAALDYYLNKQIIDSDKTQSEIAKEYDVSPSTVSKTYIKILDYVQEKNA